MVWKSEIVHRTKKKQIKTKQTKNSGKDRQTDRPADEPAEQQSERGREINVYHCLTEVKLFRSDVPLSYKGEAFQVQCPIVLQR